MAVGLRPKFNQEDIKKVIAERLQRIDQALLFRLQRVGEQFVIDARRSGDYTDRTGNLRSSIGYVILKNGKTVAENFKQVKNGPDGVPAAQALVAELKGKFKFGYVLIVVAGMDYAAAVESKGFDVITSSAKRAAKNLKAQLQELAKKLK